METVKLHITIEISEEDTVDTGITVERWNAMSADERKAIMRRQWNDMASWEGEGISVLTDGATGD